MEKQELLQKIEEFSQELYQRCERRIQPLHPWVLVKILPKEQQIGSIILPGTQNKVLYEGLVLETWKPFWREFRTEINGDETKVWVESQLKPGDHVIFPHYEGMPAGDLLSDKEFRLIRELTSQDDKTGVFGTLDYVAKPIKEQLQLKIDVYPNQAVEKILEEFHVIPKSVPTHTVSGE